MFSVQTIDFLVYAGLEHVLLLWSGSPYHHSATCLIRQILWFTAHMHLLSMFSLSFKCFSNTGKSGFSLLSCDNYQP
jgi:hypothetical protein